MPTDLKLALFKFSTYGSKTVPMITNLRSWLDLNDPEKSLWNQWKIHSDDFIASFLQVLSAPLIDFLKIPKLQELYKVCFHGKNIF